jgi:hypothetical protein
MASRILFKNFSVAKGASVFTAAGFTTAGMYDVLQNPAQSDVAIHNQPVTRSVYSSGSLTDAEIDAYISSKQESTNTVASSATSLANYPEVAVIRGKLEKAPITTVEADSVVSTLAENPQVLQPFIESLLPRHIEVDVTRVMKNVHRIITDENIVTSVLQKIEGAHIIQVKEEGKKENEVNSTWNKLAEKYFCSVCLDVFAAPHILECGHTYCWDCLYDLKNSCSSEDNSVTVVHECPECRHPMNGDATLELRYDEIICKEVDEIPDCVEKQNWKDKRQRFVKHRETVAKVVPKAEANISEDDEEDDDEDWNIVLQYLVPIITLVTVCIIIKCRS